MRTIQVPNGFVKWGILGTLVFLVGWWTMSCKNESFVDVALPGEWAVYGPVPSAVQPHPESDIPASQAMPAALTLGNQSYSCLKVKPEKGVINLMSLFSHGGLTNAIRTGDWAYLTGEIHCATAGTVLIGSGADWWMQWVIDGKPVYDTLALGNQTGDYSIFNHVFKVTLEKGSHTVCVLVKSGSAGWTFVAGSSPKDRKRFVEVEKAQRGMARNAQELEAVIQSTAKTNSHMKLVIFGSSVASGAGAADNHGWAYFLKEVLEKRNWTVVNKSVGGDSTTRLLSRFNRDLLPEKPDVVIIGLSLANEGLVTSPAETFDRYTRNMRKLIQLCRKHGIVPVISNGYPNNAYTRSHYENIRKFTAELSRWPVASINFMGAVDEGNGHWPDGCWKDGAHPNERGHAEMYYSIAPSLFDMLIDPCDPLPAPSSSWMTYRPDPAVNAAPLTHHVIDPIHSFSLAFTVMFPRTVSGRSLLAAVEGNVLSVSQEGRLTYEAEGGGVIQVGERVQAERPYHLAVTHSYINQQTRLWVDGVMVGTVSQQIAPRVFTLAGSPDCAGGEARYRNVMLYRGCLDGEHVMALAQGQVLRSSLELYAPLADRPLVSHLPVFNAAPTDAKLELQGDQCRSWP